MVGFRRVNLFDLVFRVVASFRVEWKQPHIFGTG